MSPIVCPTRQQLSDWCLGILDESTGESVMEHVECCPDCENTVAELELESDTLIEELIESLRPQSSLDPRDDVDEQPDGVAPVEKNARAGGASETWLGEPVPTRLREYELLEKLGEGAMGTVFKARHAKLQRVVAVKILRHTRIDHSPSLARFAREIQAVARLNHPHIVSAHDAGEAGGMHFLVMEFVDGADVHRIVKHGGPLEVADACEIIRQAALGLQHAHEHGLVHRDVKPSNLLITTDGCVRVTDLGLALHEEDAPTYEELTNTGQVMGTVDYMAPEQAADSHQVDRRADVYSLGCTLYRLLAGRAPFSGPRYNSAAKKLMAHAQATPPPLASFRDDVPDQLIQLIEQMTVKSPGGRPDTAAQVAQTLARWTAESDLSALVAGMGDAARQAERVCCADGISHLDKAFGGATREPLPQSSPRRRWWLGAAAIMLLIAGAATGIAVKIRHSDGTETVVKAPKGSRVEIAANGNVNVKLPGSKTPAAPNAKREAASPATAMVLSQPLKRQPASPSIAFSRDGTLLATASFADRTIRVWHVATGKKLLQFKAAPRDPPPAGRHFPIAFSPDGSQIATGGSSIVLWDLATGKQVHQLVYLEKIASSIAFSPDGKTLAFCENRSVIHLWDLGSGRLREQIKCRIDVAAIHYSFEGKLIAVGADRGSIMHVSPLGLTDALDEKKAAAGSTNERTGVPARNWNVLLQGSPYSPRARARVAFLDKERSVLGVWDMVSGQLLDRIPVKSDHGIVCSVAISHDRKQIAVAYRDGAVDLWKLKGRFNSDERTSEESTQEEARSTATEYLQLDHAAFGRSGFVAVSRDGRLVATSSVDGTIRVWEADTGRQLCQCITNQVADDQSLLPLVFSADGAQIVSGGSQISFYDSKSGKEIRRLDEPGACCLAVSPDGNVLVAGGTNIRLFLFATGNKMQTIDQEEPVDGLFFRDNGSLIAITRSGRLKLVLEGFRNHITAHGGNRTDGQDHVKPSQARPATEADKATNKSPIPVGNWDLRRHGIPILDNGRVLVSSSSSAPDGTGQTPEGSGDAETAPANGVPSLSAVSLRDRLRFVDAVTGETICELDVNDPGAVAISADHTLVAVCSADGKVHLFRTATRGRGDGGQDVNSGGANESRNEVNRQNVAVEVKSLAAQVRDAKQQKLIAADRLIQIGKPAVEPLKQALQEYQREPKLVEAVTRVLHIIEGLSEPAEDQGLSIRAGPEKPAFAADEPPTFIVVCENKTDAVLVGQIDFDNFDTQGLMLEHADDGAKWRLLDTSEIPDRGQPGTADKRVDNGMGPGIRVMSIETGALVRRGYRWVKQAEPDPKQRGRLHLPPGRYRATWQHHVGATRDLAIPTQDRPVRYLRGTIKGAPFEFTVLAAPEASKP